MIYFCIQCKEEHAENDEAVLFKTGYVLKDESKIPLGICQQVQSKMNA